MSIDDTRATALAYATIPSGLEVRHPGLRFCVERIGGTYFLHARDTQPIGVPEMHVRIAVPESVLALPFEKTEDAFKAMSDLIAARIRPVGNDAGGIFDGM